MGAKGGRVPAERFNDPLSLDVTDDLIRVDRVMTQVLKDRAIWNEFIRDPNGVLVRLGLHPPTSPEINDRANRIFYATLTNKPLLELVIGHYERFTPSDEALFQKTSIDAASQGEIAHHIDLDLEAFHHYLDHPDVMRQALRLSLHDLNEKRILREHHSPDEIAAFVEGLIEAAQQRRRLANHPRLEEWDRNYGIGFTFGGPSFAELGAPTTLAAAVEVVVAGTNALLVYQVVGFWGPTFTARSVASGDEASVRGTAIVGRLMDFSAELLSYVQRFERVT